MNEPQRVTVEATATLVRVGTCWFVHLRFDDGTEMQSEQAAASREEAQTLLDAWCATQPGIQVMKAQ